MGTDATAVESFGAKLSSHATPGHSWGVEDLGDYAQRQHDQILRSEQSLAPIYWALGQALSLVHKQLGRGYFSKFLAERGIHKVRASKARAIFRAFSSPESLKNMGVEEAYAQRAKRQSQTRQKRQPQAEKETEAHEESESNDRPAPEDGPEEIEAFLEDVCDRADRLVDVAAFAQPDQRQQLFALYREALSRLEYLGTVLGADDEAPKTFAATEITSDQRPETPEPLLS